MNKEVVQDVNPYVFRIPEPPHENPWLNMNIEH